MAKRLLGLVGGSVLFLTACSGSGDGATLGAGGGADPGAGLGASGAASANDAGASGTTPRPGGANGANDAGKASDAKGPPPGPGPGSGGIGGKGPGEHDVTLAGTNVALHVPNKAAPLPLLVLLHGQGDTGRNFLNVWLAKGLPGDLLIAAPDDNSDGSALDVEAALESQYNVDVSRRYAYGFSQGGAYAAFLLYDANAAKHFTAIGLGSSGLAQAPSSIPAATAGSPSVAVVIDPADMNNTWGQGKHVMEDFTGLLQARGYNAKLWLHGQGHSLAPTETGAAMAWMRQ